MPVSLRSLGGGMVRVRTPGGVKARRTTRAKAEAQRRLLNAVEHGWKPGGSRGAGMGLGTVGRRRMLGG